MQDFRELRAETVAAAWQYAKQVEAFWDRMSADERAMAMATMRRYRHILNNWNRQPLEPEWEAV